MDIIVIYDFDGTLTPYSMPQYQVLKDCGYDDQKLFSRIENMIKCRKIGLYEAYVEAVFQILSESNIEKSMNSICKGAMEVIYNPGVIAYFERFKNLKHYVITSGYEDYIRRTKINPYLQDVLGTRVKIEGNETSIVDLMTDEKKVEAIEQIIKESGTDFENVIYIGDGLTDRYAFEYIHKKGGVSIFVGEKTEQVKDLCVDYYFEKNFEEGSSLDKYIQSRIRKNKN